MKNGDRHSATGWSTWLTQGSQSIGRCCCRSVTRNSTPPGAVGELVHEEPADQNLLGGADVEERAVDADLVARNPEAAHVVRAIVTTGGTLTFTLAVTDSQGAQVTQRTASPSASPHQVTFAPL